MKMYIAVLDEFPDYMTPTLVAHAVLGAHQKFDRDLKKHGTVMYIGPFKLYGWYATLTLCAIILFISLLLITLIT